MVVRVSSGLTSRCITLYHAYCLAKEKKDSLIVIWPVSNDCYIHFWDVFDKDSFFGIRVKVVEELQKNFQSIRMFIKQKKIVKIIRECIGRIFFRLKQFQLDYYLRSSTKKWIVEFAPPQNIPFTTESDAYLNYSMNVKFLFRWLYERNNKIVANAYCGLVSKEVSAKFVDLLSDVVKFSRKYSDECEKVLKVRANGGLVGIHIRRTDQDLSIRESKTEFFIEKMRDLILKNPSIKFFLATDDVSEENLLRKLFSDCLIINQHKIFGRDSIKGMENAIVDVLCLSKCDYILGSYNSVYSYFAAQYGNIDLFILKNTENKKDRWLQTYYSRGNKEDFN